MQSINLAAQSAGVRVPNAAVTAPNPGSAAPVSGVRGPGAGVAASSAGTAPARPGSRSLLAGLLLRWHLCSLDAPTIAVLWALLLGRLAGVSLPAAEMLVLGLGTWVVYVLDRVLDGTGVSAASTTLRQRHHFHRDHRRVLLRLCWLAAVAVALLCRQLPVRLVELYLALGVPVGAYALIVHRRLLWPGRAGADLWTEIAVTRNRGYRKEAAVALLFTSAVAAPAAVAALPAVRPALLIVGLLLAGLCWLNCSLITHVESGHAEGAQTDTRTDAQTGAAALEPARGAQRRQLIASALGLASAAAIACACSFFHLSDGIAAGVAEGVAQGVTDPRSAPSAAAVLISCLLLLSLLMSSEARDAALRTRIRVLADLGLLSPLFFLLRHA